MNINWGTGITIAMGSFMLMILSFVVAAWRENIDLVSADYYAQELQYQERMEQMGRARAADAKIEFTMQADRVQVQLPEGVQKGEMHFFRPSNAKYDFVQPIAANAQGKQVVQDTRLIAGLWKVKTTWEQRGERYYNETSIVVP
jgi:nitrogen fixation protein FixH